MKKLWSIIYVLIIIFPIGSTWFSWLDFLSGKYGVGIFEIIILIISLISLLTINYNKSFSVKKLFFSLFFFASLLIYVFSIYKGYRTYGLSSINDGFKYSISFLYILIGFKLYDSEFNLDNILKLTRIGFIGYTIVTIFTYYAFFNSGDRVSSNNFSLAIIIVPFEILNLFRKKGNYKMSILVFLCFIIDMLISQDRAVSLLTFVVSLVSILISFHTYSERKNFLLLTVMAIAFATIIVSLFIFDFSIVDRFMGSRNETDTLSGRVNTFKYYWEIVCNNIHGVGFGYEMHFVNSSNYVLPSSTYQVDNAFIVYAVKCGLFFSIMMILFSIVPIFKKIVEDKTERTIFVISYMALLVSAVGMTSQIIQGRATSAFIWVLVGMSFNGKAPFKVKENSELLLSY